MPASCRCFVSVERVHGLDGLTRLEANGDSWVIPTSIPAVVPLGGNESDRFGQSGAGGKDVKDRLAIQGVELCITWIAGSWRWRRDATAGNNHSYEDHEQSSLDHRPQG